MNATSMDRQPAWWNVPARLMPDYNVKATLYWFVAVTLGVSALGWSVHQLATAPTAVWVHIALCTSMAMLAGLVPVRNPRSSSSFTAGEIFIFLLLLLNGVEAAVVAAAAEALVGSWRTSRRWTSRIASPAMAALALFAAGSAFEYARRSLDAAGMFTDGALLAGSVLVAVAYIVTNTLLVTMVPHLKKNEPIRLRSFVASFGWIAVAYGANAAIATLLCLSFRQSGWVVVVAAIPAIAIILATAHFYFRRKESDEEAKLARASEAEGARLHVEELRASERRFHSAFTHASIGMALVSFDGTVRQSNAALQTLLGWDLDASTRMDFNQFIAFDGSTTLANLIMAIAGRSDQKIDAEFRCKHQDGSDVWVEVNGSFFSEPGSAEPCLILQLQDITARKLAEAKLNHIAFHDGLTGLPNRGLFNEHLRMAIEAAAINPQRAFGVMFLDFDRFKLINDSLGHTVGDQFLVQVSRRIEQCVREGDVVARLGGDEFAILAEDRDTPNFVLFLAERLQEALRRPIHIGGTDVTTSVSIGITYSALGYCKAEEMLRDADIAMYKAKGAGKARYAIFDVSLHEEVAGRLRLEGDLRRALAQGTMSIDYQPLFDIQTSDLVGFEALARWKHPELGQISPGVFIPIAEESGSIVQLTDFVLNAACVQLKRWQETDDGFANLKMHVNVAGNDVAGQNLVSRVAKAVMTARLSPEHLSIELTENILMESLEAAMDVLKELHALGIGLSVDDFGTGYSSLSHLSTLPIDSLKIDRSFVKDLRPGSKEAAVIRAIVLLGSSLGKEVIAEGIETQEQLEELAALGCDVGQGYLLARPQSGACVDALLENLLIQRSSARAVVENAEFAHSSLH